jgi:hypothetical protein
VNGGAAGNVGVGAAASDPLTHKLLNMSLKPRSNYLLEWIKDGRIPGQGDESYIRKVCREFNCVSSCSPSIFEKNRFDDDASRHVNGNHETKDP